MLNLTAVCPCQARYNVARGRHCSSSLQLALKREHWLRRIFRPHQACRLFGKVGCPWFVCIIWLHPHPLAMKQEEKCWVAKGCLASELLDYHWQPFGSGKRWSIALCSATASCFFQGLSQQRSMELAWASLKIMFDWMLLSVWGVLRWGHPLS